MLVVMARLHPLPVRSVVKEGLFRLAATTPVSVGPLLTWLKSTIAIPQCAMAQSGSAAATFPNDFPASSSQNEMQERNATVEFRLGLRLA
jgi:hypothetical protein